MRSAASSAVIPRPSSSLTAVAAPATNECNSMGSLISTGDVSIDVSICVRENLRKRIPTQLNMAKILHRQLVDQRALRAATRLQNSTVHERLKFKIKRGVTDTAFLVNEFANFVWCQTTAFLERF